MIKLSLKTKKISIIRVLGTLKDLLLLFREGTGILLNNSDKDEKEMRTYSKHQDGYGDVGPLPFPPQCHPCLLR